jgi:hypothetical protein
MEELKTLKPQLYVLYMHTIVWNTKIYFIRSIILLLLKYLDL